jgi:hypothetical protein
MNWFQFLDTIPNTELTIPWAEQFTGAGIVPAKTEYMCAVPARVTSVLGTISETSWSKQVAVISVGIPRYSEAPSPLK